MVKYLFILLVSLMPALAAAQLTKDTTTAEEPIYNTSGLSKQPEYPGGVDAFYMHVRKNLRIPEIDQDLNTRILVTFVIEKDGTITNIVVPRDPGFGLAHEATRVLKGIKEKWSPGLNDGKPVRVRYSLPIMIVYKAPAEPKAIEEE